MANLLKNPGFEGSFRTWNGIEQIKLSEGWLPFWVAQQTGDEQWRNRRPIYRPVAGSTSPTRVRSGQSARRGFLALGGSGDHERNRSIRGRPRNFP